VPLSYLAQNIEAIKLNTDVINLSTLPLSRRIDNDLAGQEVYEIYWTVITFMQAPDEFGQLTFYFSKVHFKMITPIPSLSYARVMTSLLHVMFHLKGINEKLLSSSDLKQNGIAIVGFNVNQTYQCKIIVNVA